MSSTFDDNLGSQTYSPPKLTSFADVGRPRRWLSPLEILDFKEALEAHAELVTLKGKQFKLRYETRFEGGRNVEYVKWNPTDGSFVPMGTARVNDILESDTF